MTTTNNQTKKPNTKTPAPFELVPEWTIEGRKRFYKATLPTGESLAVEIADCVTGFAYRRDLGWFWRFNGLIKTTRGQKEYKYKTVATYCEAEKKFPCMGLYNVTHDGQKLNFKYDKATDAEILKAIYKEATKSKIILTDAEISAGFDNLESLTPRQYKRKEQQAKALYNKTLYRYEKYERQAAFISSGSVHGFYFPSLGARLRCIAFRKGRPVLCYSMGE